MDNVTQKAKWWTEDRRGNLLGHGIRWGNKWAHITRILDGGPGANDIRPICGGVQSVVMINSGLDVNNQQECEDWKHFQIDIQLGAKLEDVIRPHRLSRLCPKCKSSYEKQAGA